MSLLNHTKTVKFDPEIKEHRDAVKNFMKRNAWVDSEFRFSHDPAFGSVASQVKEKLLAWYLQNDKLSAN